MKYSFKKFLGIQPAVRKALDWVFENGSLPTIKGEWFFVDPDNGASTAGGSADSPLDSIETAYAKCTSGSGDGIVLLSGGTTSAATTSYIDEEITWSKHGITVVGAAAPTRMAMRARVANKTRTTGTITTIAFPTATTITDSASGFLTAGFEVGQKISIDENSNTNDGAAIITALTAGTMTCSASTFSVETAATAGATVIVSYVVNLITVSGDNNAFYNIHFGNFGANVLELGCIEVSGNRNYFGNCHLIGAGNATPAAETGAYDLKLNGSSAITFEGCTFGSDTIIHAAANASILYDGTVGTTRFYDCDIYSYSETAGHGAINSADATSMQGVDIFSRCRIINWKPNGAGALTAAVIGTAPTSGHFLFDSCSFFGYTAIGAAGAVYVSNSAAVAAGAGGISTTPT